MRILPGPFARINVSWMQKPEQDPAPGISPANNFYATLSGRSTAIDALRKFTKSAINAGNILLITLNQIVC